MQPVKEIRICVDTSNRPPIVKMAVGEKEYFMLTIKRGPLASRLIEVLRNEFNVIDGRIGMAFDYKASVAWNALTLFDDNTVVGVYVPISDFDKVRDILGQ